jgi:hypothetical protein
MVAESVVVHHSKVDHRMSEWVMSAACHLIHSAGIKIVDCVSWPNTSYRHAAA